MLNIFAKRSSGGADDNDHHISFDDHLFGLFLVHGDVRATLKSDQQGSKKP